MPITYTECPAHGKLPQDRNGGEVGRDLRYDESHSREWYQEHILTAEEVRLALGLATSLQVDALLKHRGIPSKYSADDFAADLATDDQLRL